MKVQGHVPSVKHASRADPTCVERIFGPSSILMVFVVRHQVSCLNRRPDIGKAVTRLGYAPTQCIGEGLQLAMPWYIGKMA